MPDGPASPLAVTCPLCAGVSSRAFRVRERDYLRCAHCRLLWVPEAQHPSQEQAAARYRTHRNESLDKGYRRFLEPAIAAALRYLPPEGTVLDFGCGPSPAATRILAERGVRAIPYDPVFPHEPLPAGPVGAVLAIEVFEHFREPGRDVALAASLVAPGGVLVVQTLFVPAAENLASWWYLRDPTHLAFYSARTFEVLGSLHGLEPLESDGHRLVVMRRPEEGGDATGGLAGTLHPEPPAVRPRAGGPDEPARPSDPKRRSRVPSP
ncbi:MAG: class I SAM-dependent methyltransferase [Candidatus Riflebacteria bacterium]|nr:class I SAM-dependent methyltransferase [Candidatus Riflebacteria bacterium]